MCPDVCVCIYMGVFVNKSIYINVHAVLVTMRSIHVKIHTHANTSMLVDAYRLGSLCLHTRSSK